MTIEIHGDCPAEFEPVLHTFQQHFQDGHELGASISVCIDDAQPVHIYAGHTDRKKEHPWLEDSITCIYSSGKAVVAYLIACAVSDGLLDYEAPIASVWPEFAAHGKAAVTLAHALSHQAGLPGIANEMEPSCWLDWHGICDRLAEMEPMWEPGTASGYHPQTFGFIAGEVYRRATGKTIGEAVRAYGLDLYCGLPPDQQDRAAFMPKPPHAPDLGELNELTKVAFLKPWSSTARVSREDWMAAEIPASNMHGNARALARLLHPVANDGVSLDGRSVISNDALGALCRERIVGDDLVLPFNLSWAAGIMRNINRHFGPNKNALGQSGFGGSAVVMDPDNRMTIAYVMNKMSPHLVADPRALHLIEAVYQCL